jgi:SMI1 / KNR4 family (SUKH-1)
MSHLIAEIKRLFPTGTYGAPCTEAELAEAEELLGMKFPGDLRIMYLHFNGLDVFGSASKLFPLLPGHANTSLVKSTLFWRTGPGAVENIIFYGMSEKQYCFGARMTEPQVIVEYNYDLDEPEVLAPTILEAYAKDQEWVKSLGLPPLGE